MLYLASGYEEGVGEGFESRMTRLTAWKGARVQRMHVRARMGAQLGAREHAQARRGLGAREGARALGRCTGGHKDARGAAGRAAGGQRRVYCSPESMSFTRNHLNDLK
ncbi:hypothetical protein CRG98_007788 [Punica granatum]|uniref:Uncharacterized protein n=1 Tax=Punica granatum TaxID=22663 RepID=A0A2I0KTS1_PUNGR|nr:hypothetical protein CRG98_007788 [Punica granatum]